MDDGKNKKTIKKSFKFGIQFQICIKNPVIIATIPPESVNLFCDGVTVITPMLGETVRPYLRRLESKMGVWTSGVCLDHFERTGANMREELALEGATPINDPKKNNYSNLKQLT